MSHGMAVAPCSWLAHDRSASDTLGPRNDLLATERKERKERKEPLQRRGLPWLFPARALSLCLSLSSGGGEHTRLGDDSGRMCPTRWVDACTSAVWCRNPPSAA